MEQAWRRLCGTLNYFRVFKDFNKLDGKPILELEDL